MGNLDAREVPEVADHNPDRNPDKKHESPFKEPAWHKPDPERAARAHEAGSKELTKSANKADDLLKENLDKAYGEEGKPEKEKTPEEKREQFINNANKYARDLNKVDLDLAFGEKEGKTYSFSFESYNINGQERDPQHAIEEFNSKKDLRADQVNVQMRLKSIEGKEGNMLVSVPLRYLQDGNIGTFIQKMHETVDNTFGAAYQYYKMDSGKALAEKATKPKEGNETAKANQEALQKLNDKVSKVNGNMIVVNQAANRETLVMVTTPRQKEPLCLSVSGGVFSRHAKNGNTQPTNLDAIPELRKT